MASRADLGNCPPLAGEAGSRLVVRPAPLWQNSTQARQSEREAMAMATLPKVLSDVRMDNSFLSETIQVCVVTRDYRRTMAGMVEAGIGPWRVYTFARPQVTETTYRGRPTEFSMKLCLTFTGNMMWEIVQPLDGPSIYKEFLERHGEGVHHVAFACADLSWDERVREFERRGFEMIQSGIWLGRVPWAYFGTEDATTTTFEVFQIPDGFVLPEPEEWYPAPPPR
jgi:methylmalonyl-CoA/ethylmalonyl-CoA epimerase